MTDERYELNDGHIHEAIDRIDVAINYLRSTLAEHALIDAVDAYAAQIKSVNDRLFELYQAIARHEHVADIAKLHGLKAAYALADP